MPLLPADETDAEPRDPDAPRREGQILVKTTPEEAGLLDSWAEREGRPLAVLAREAVLRAASLGR